MTAELIDAGASMVHLNGLAGFEQTGRLERPTIERMARLVDALGHPQRAYPVIRLTRTSEKGSTAAMTASLLRGQRLGLGTYTSAALKRSAGVLP